MKIVESYSGDGNFNVTVNKEPKSFKVTVRATGKTISEVVPAGFLVPLAVVGTLSARSKDEAELNGPLMMPPPPPPRSSPGLGGKKK